MQVSVNSFQSLSALNRDYKCDTSGLEHLHKSWPDVSWGNDTLASGKPHFNNAHARSWKCPKLEIRHYWHFINNHTMISLGVPPYVKSDYEWKHGVIRIVSLPAPRWGVRSPEAERKDSDSTSGLPCAAHPAHLFRHQWEGGTTGRRPLSASLGSAGPLRNTDTFAPFRTRYELCGDQKLSSSATTSLLNWRFSAQSEEARGHISWTQRVR